MRDLFLITYSLGILLNISLNLLALREFCKPYIFFLDIVGVKTVNECSFPLLCLLLFFERGDY